MRTSRLLCCTTVILLLTAPAWPHAHVHIGRNADGVWGNDDDDTLWIFGMPPAATPGNYWPNFPDWGDDNDPYTMVGEPLELVYVPSTGRYVCEWLYCWHSGHPPHGLWQLGGADANSKPDWRLAIERVAFDPDFAMERFTPPIQELTADGEQYVFPETDMHFDGAKPNGVNELNPDGTDPNLGSWVLHSHVRYVVDNGLSPATGGNGLIYEATFRAVDVGTTGFGDSEAYTMRFETVPEPATLALLTLAAGGTLTATRRRRKALR